jgi:hypothetical protein
MNDESQIRSGKRGFACETCLTNSSVNLSVKRTICVHVQIQERQRITMVESDGLSIAAFALSSFSFIVTIAWSIISFVLTQRYQDKKNAEDAEHRRLLASFDQLRNYTSRRDHPWNVASWLFNADQYPGLPFKLGEVEFRLGEEIFAYASDRNLGNGLFQEVKSAIKAAMMDCCVELETLLDLTLRNEVDRPYLRKMVNTLVYRLAKSDRAGVRPYGEVLRDLAVLYQLPFRVEIRPNGALVLGNWYLGQVPQGRDLPLYFSPWM